ncbi:hypothetical protein R2R70_02085 [Cobetia sp. SIMBA_158]|uniref:hypothetical protein n=1 Tax=Cobetia sp. SIMBA_158 TaxID=3081617 RepID=UPI00397F2AE1
MNSSSREWFFTPLPEQYSKRDNFDWTRVVRLLGRKIHPAFSKLIIDRLDKNMIMMAPGIHDECYYADPASDDLSVKSMMVETYCPDDMMQVTRIIPNLEGDAVSLAFEIRLKSGKLVYLDEYALGKTFDSDSSDNPKTAPLLGDIVIRMQRDYWNEDGGSTYFGSDIHVSPYWKNRAKMLTRMNLSEAKHLAMHIAKENGLPMLVGGQLFEHEPGDKDTDMDVPELEMSEEAEAKKRNPHYGALSF